MSADAASLASLALAVAGMVLMIFTIGALAGWRWSSPRVRHEPTWIFLTGQAGWGLFLLSLVATPAREEWGWLPWLALLRLQARWSLSGCSFGRAPQTDHAANRRRNGRHAASYLGVADESFDRRWGDVWPFGPLADRAYLRLLSKG